MAQHPCEQCGDGTFAPVVRMVREGDALLTRYTGRCGTCRSVRDFRFRIDREWDDDGGSPEEVRFGRSGPSELIDAGQWLRAVDRILSDTPSTVLGVSEEEWRARRYLFTAAAESVAEVLKFIPPDADEVPDGAFWTDDGRAEHDRDPGRFRREALEHLRSVCLGLAARYTG